MVGHRRQSTEVVGYIVSRAFSAARHPTIEDKRTVEAFFQLLPTHHIVFGCFSPSTDFDGSCIVTQYTFFDFARGRPPKPLPVSIRNLGSTLGSGHYDDVEFGVSTSGMERQVRMSQHLVESMEQEMTTYFHKMSELAASTRDAELACAEAERQYMAHEAAAAALQAQTQAQARAPSSRPSSRPGSRPESPVPFVPAITDSLVIL